MSRTSRRIVAAGMAAVALSACSSGDAVTDDPPDATPDAPATEGEDATLVSLVLQVPRTVGDLRIVLTETGRGAGGIVESVSSGASEDLDLRVGESATFFDHEVEVASVDGQEVLVRVTGPDGTVLGP